MEREDSEVMTAVKVEVIDSVSAVNLTALNFEKGVERIPVVAIRKPSKKKPKDKPKRPLSAYNFFFKEERGKILRVVLENATELNNDPKADDYLDEAAIARLRKDSGKVSFEEMGKIIGQRWKNIDPERLTTYQDMATSDTHRYKKEMQSYNGRQEAKMRNDAHKPSLSTGETKLNEEGGYAHGMMHHGYAAGGFGVGGYTYGTDLGYLNHMYMPYSTYALGDSVAMSHPQLGIDPSQPNYANHSNMYGMLGNGFPHGSVVSYQRHHPDGVVTYPSQPSLGTAQQAPQMYSQYPGPGGPGWGGQ
jgi:hypothetical protein